jgi:hypothetical protein
VSFFSTIIINPAIPGTNPASTGIGGFISNFYSFALLISGIIAFGAIVYGGVRYAVGRGNPSSESEAKSWITSALLGMLLLAGAYVILYTINPTIVDLKVLKLPELASPPPADQPINNSPSCVGATACGNPWYCSGSCPSPNQTCTRQNGNSPYACVTNSVSGFCSDSNPTGQCLRPGTTCQRVAGYYSCVFTSPTAAQCTSNNKNTCTYYGINANPPIPGCEGIGGVIQAGNASCPGAPTSKQNCYNVLICPP